MLWAVALSLIIGHNRLLLSENLCCQISGSLVGRNGIKAENISVSASFIANLHLIIGVRQIFTAIITVIDVTKFDLSM